MQDNELLETAIKYGVPLPETCEALIKRIWKKNGIKGTPKFKK